MKRAILLMNIGGPNNLDEMELFLANMFNAEVYFHNAHLAYQSRLGPLRWIVSCLEEKLQSLKKKKVIVFPIAFALDDSETAFELEIEYREKADAMGFVDYRVAKAPNSHPEFVKRVSRLYEDMKGK